MSVKVKPPTRAEVLRVHRAMCRVISVLDKFETTCVKNGLKVKRITFQPNKTDEWSDVFFDLKEIR